METNPYRPLMEMPRNPQTKRVSSWWIVTLFAMVPVVMYPFFNEAGWYGIGHSGQIQRIAQITAYLIGTSCSYVGALRGSRRQQFLCAPIALAATVLIIGIILD